MVQDKESFVYPASRGFVSRPLLKMVVVVVVMVAFMTVAPVKAQAPNCTLNLSEVVVMDDFNITRYAGFWYEIWWIPPRDFKPEWAYTDYFHFHQIDEGGDGMNGYIFGRDQEDAGVCYRHDLYLTPTDGDVSAKMKRQTTQGGTSTDYWVLDTDYDSYAYVFSCLEKFTNGTCGDTDMSLWSREKAAPQQRLDEAEAKFQELCMDMSRLIVTPHNHDHSEACRYADAGTASKLMTSVAPLFTLLLACLLLNTRVLYP